ncbi:hypothetical protein PR048_001150 [Dryococelus australis]|uniref:Uncharacterized protein n=1 Tax=Dryococelus australis TaxID=614101 RepID=A0ABQ9IGN0_9NEOP|nr:hypothetical protein PR048_001150 [Dryococelus australis]
MTSPVAYAHKAMLPEILIVIARVKESVCRETVASRNNTVRKNSSEGEPQSLGAKKRSIKAISSHRELNALIRRESHLRGSQHTLCLTHSLDKLRWRLLRKALRKYVCKLEQETNKKQYKKLLVEAKQILQHNVL